MNAGERYGSFVLDHPLGSGGYATVWAARHVSGERVAIKIGHQEVEPASIQREAEQIASFDHPGIVYVYDAGTRDGRSWMALERATGTLADLESPLPVVDLAEHLLRALGHLHARGVVHRDLKPSNILIGCSPRHGRSSADRAGVRIADFGIAWSAAQHGPSSGTKGWMAPEVAQGVVHPSSDVYAVALILQSLVDAQGMSDLGPWIRRATSPAVADRFPTVAHALAALPGSSGQTVVTFDACTIDTPPPLETATRPVALRIAPLVAGGDDLAAIVPPVVPLAPPLPAPRVPRATLLDAGMSLLAFRPMGTAGRTELLLSLWERALRDSVRVRGREVDTVEVIETLRRWGTETGRPIDIATTSEQDGVDVPPLSSWSLAERAQELGFDLESAMRLSTTATTPEELRSVVLEAVRANLVDVGEKGLVLRGWREGNEPVSADLEAALEESWWRGDSFGVARTLPAYLASNPTGWRRDAVEALARIRVEKRRDAQSARLLEEHAKTARCGGARDLADQLAIEAGGVWVRARKPEEARQILRSVVEPSPRYAGALALHWGFVGVMERDFGAEVHLREAVVLSEGRFRPVAYATLCDVYLQHGKRPEALEFARAGVAAIDPDRPDDALAVHGALILAYMHQPVVDEEAITAQIAAAAELLPRATNRAAVARFALFRAQQAMRLADWDRADRLLYEAQVLDLRCGGTATFMVLNHGLVGLHRGDLASIAAATPASWDAERAVAAAYVRPLMDLHSLYVALGQDHDTLDPWFEPLERGEPLPALTHEGIRLAAGLAPAQADRLLALIRSP